MNLAHYGLKIQSYTIREELHQGRRHLVLPVVMLVEGVHAGSHGPLLHLADEMGRFPGAWNGIPVVVNHPQRDGMHVSANSPEIIDSETVGRIYHAAMVDGKLKAETWIDEAAISRVSPEALATIQEGNPLDVSVGVFTDDEETPGQWNGEAYSHIARNHRPDHLALLPGGQGACSWQDGCGIRANSKGGQANEMKTNASRPKYNGTESTVWSAPTLSDFGVSGNWGDLSPADRAKVASHYLLGHADAATFENLKLPVVNPKTGKLNERALRAVIGGRGAAVQGVTPSRLSGARRMAYRLLNDEFNAGLTIPNTLEETRKELARQGLAVNEMGFQAIAEAIQTKLDRMDDDTKLHFLQEVFPDYFIYRVSYRGTGPSDDLFKRPYTLIDADGDGQAETVEFTGEAQPVVKEVRYNPVQQSTQVNSTEKEVANMATEKGKGQSCCPEKVDALIANEATKWTKDDREFLLTMTAEQLEKITPAPVQTNAAKPVEITQEQAMKVLSATLGDPDKALALFPPEIQEQLRDGLKLHRERRAELIDRIVANQAAPVFTKESLAGRSMEDLDDLARAIVPKSDFSPLGPQVNVNESKGGTLLPPGVGE